ncbi:GNAT family N-acetyltransferase [Natronomonas sp. EA1]|uniref:GNAT family N-acetyltransferase n=1 Tax=Natronomonas sp. EA1 TaxID=3421655 RepID=UPI003EB8919E
MTPRDYPDEIAGPYDPPPKSFTDREGREIEIRRYESGLDPLVEMYLDFDPEDRAQGIPPTEEKRIRKWLEAILGEGCINVVAVHEAPVGHATLVPDGDGAYELAIFVLSEYQESGIGTELITGLLGAGRESGIDRVWLTVERWNRAAIVLYEKVGFETHDDGSFELEMTARLSD